MAVAAGFRRRLQTGPALRISPIPLAGLTLSAVLHGALIVAGVIAVNALKESQPKVYVVNLVPAIPAIGRPEGQGTTPAPPTARPVPPPPAPRPAPELPTRATAPAPDLPPRDLPPRVRTRESAGLPDRSLPPTSAAPRTSRPDQKELPSVASAASIPRPPSPTAAPEAGPAREAASPPPAPAGLPTGAVHGKGKLSIEVDFPYAWYVKILHGKISEKWDPRALQGLQPLVSFEIGRKGDVNPGRIFVKQSSGNRAYDQLAVRSIVEAAPFPPLPDDFKDARVTIVIQFKYAAEQG